MAIFVSHGVVILHSDPCYNMHLVWNHTSTFNYSMFWINLVVLLCPISTLSCGGQHELTIKCWISDNQKSW